MSGGSLLLNPADNSFTAAGGRGCGVMANGHAGMNGCLPNGSHRRGERRGEDSDDEFQPAEPRQFQRLNSFNSEMDFYDATEGLDEYSSDDDSGSLRSQRRVHGSYHTLMQRLKEETARREKAEADLAKERQRLEELQRLATSAAVSKDFSAPASTSAAPTTVMTNAEERGATAVASGCSGDSTMNGEVEAEEQEGTGTPDGGVGSEPQEVVVARLVSEALAKAAAKVEAAERLEAVLQQKEREMSRMRDKLQYWERMNQEMTQQNTIAIEALRKRRRMWRSVRRAAVVGGLVALGAGLMVWASYTAGPPPEGEESSQDGSGDGTPED